MIESSRKSDVKRDPDWKIFSLHLNNNPNLKFQLPELGLGGRGRGETRKLKENEKQGNRKTERGLSRIFCTYITGKGRKGTTERRKNIINMFWSENDARGFHENNKDR